MADVMTPEQRAKNMKAIKSISELEQKNFGNKGYATTETAKRSMANPIHRFRNIKL